MEQWYCTSLILHTLADTAHSLCRATFIVLQIDESDIADELETHLCNVSLKIVGENRLDLL